MSFDIIPEPSVKSPGDRKPRRGRGFSKSEILKAGLDVKEARDMGLIVDIRRQTLYEDNVEALKQYMKDLESYISALEAELPSSGSEFEAIDVLSSLKAVKKSDAEKLVKADILTLEDLAYCELDKVSKKTGIDEDALTEMVKAALKKV
jgi:large subunit ribosomal protein L13e